MSRHLLIAFSNAAEGREDEFNDWYTNRHLGDALALDGFAAATLYRLADGEEGSYQYMAVYEVDDLAAAQAALDSALEQRNKSGNPPGAQLYRSDASAPGGDRLWLTAVSKRITRPSNSQNVSVHRH